MNEQVAARLDAEAARTAERVLAHPKASDGQKARALMFLGDRALACVRDGGLVAGSPAAPRCTESRASFERALALPLDEDTARQFRARLLVFDPARKNARELADYLAPEENPRDGALDVWRAQKVVDAEPRDPVGHYLLGRMLYTRERWRDGERELRAALDGKLPAGGFDLAARRLALVAAFRAAGPAFHTEDLVAARAHAEALARTPDAPPGARLDAGDWLARIAYFARPR